jgi:phosphomannomutase
LKGLNVTDNKAPLMLSVSGLRGLIGQSLTPTVAVAYAQAFGQWLAQDAGTEHAHVVVGRDSRPSGRMIQDAITSGLLAVGCRVSELGIVATPSVGIMIDELGGDGGVVVTASHNPIIWNGIKVLNSQGVSPPPEHVASIIKRFHANTPGYVAVDDIQPTQRVDTTNQVHVDRVLAHIDADVVASRKIKAVVDSVHGAGGAAARMLCERLGVELIHLYAEPTGQFPHTPEPTRENLTGLADAVTQYGADVGFAQDPDADRLAIVDEQGTYIGEEYSLALCAKHVLEQAGEGASTVANLSTSRMVDDIANDCGGRSLRSPVGEANVAKRMREEGAIIGGEGNGGVIWPKVGYVRDSISTIALVLELMAMADKSISQLVDSIPAYTIVKHKVDIREGMADAVVAALGQAYADARIDQQDGIRIDTDTGWLHVRPSNTEPILRIIAEARDEQQAQALVDRASQIVEEA